MAQTLIVADKTITLDKEGYLEDLSDWNEEVAYTLAGQHDLLLTEAHWEVLNVMRDFHRRRGISPIMRILVKLVEVELGPEKGNSLYLLKLFPGSPARVASKIAGLPRPHNCI
jgi:tRNA 2-thiouridine synthesizing protein E